MGLSSGGVKISPANLKVVNFKDITAAPTLEPLDGFMCQFLTGVWVLVPDFVSVDSDGISGDDMINDGDNGFEAGSTDVFIP